MKIDIGCGANKREGYVGLDIFPQEGVDIVVDFERDRLPLEDASVDAVFSSHCLEHVRQPMNILREILRVCRQGADVEIWLPFGRSDEALMIGHEIFYTELHWRHFLLDFDTAWLGDAAGRFRWHKVRYNLKVPGIDERLAGMGVSLDFAIDHFSNIAGEFAVFLEVDKTLQRSDGRQPIREFAYGRHGARIG